MVVLAIVSALLSLVLVHYQMRLNRTNSDIRFARELIESIHTFRNLALKSDTTNAVYYLQKLQSPASTPFQNVLADVVEGERIEASKEIIANLRSKTGRDFGDEPEKWIDALKGQDN